MLMRTDPNSNTISMLSFPRDMIVNVHCPAGQTWSTTSMPPTLPADQPAHSRRSPLTDLPIHYLISVNFVGFRDIVNKLGGV